MGNHKKVSGSENSFVQKLEDHLLPKKEIHRSLPLSLILPVFNCSALIGDTLESIQQQDYAPLEVIVVDAGSTDRTLEIAASYSTLISRIYTVTHYNVPDMINRGISLASGEYIAFLSPGSYYLSPHCYQAFAEKIHESGYPDLAYCGSMQREVKRKPKTILFPFDRHALEKGGAFATISACWVRADLFDRLGKFNAHYVVRSNFDLFCRMAQLDHFSTLMIDRIFIDYDFGRFSIRKALRSAQETWSILCHHFGLRKALLWFITAGHLQIIKGIWNRIKFHLSKKNN